MKDKKRVLIIIVVFIVLILAFYIIKKNTITFTLIGESNMIVQYGLPYDDPGFVAKDGFGKELSDYVTINNKVNTIVPGAYVIYYELNYNNRVYVLERIIRVGEIDLTVNNMDIVLNGEEVIYLLKGTNYDELGAEVYNKLDNTKVNINDLLITSNIDSDTPGEYTVTYTLNYKNESLTKIRKVKVLDISYDVTPSELTNKTVNIILDLKNIDNYAKTKLPDGTISSSKDIEYMVNSNGEYSFVISLLNNQEFTKVIEIDNIIENYTCKGEITSTGTKLVVSPITSVKEYKWITNSETINGSSVYTKNKSINNASVKLTLNNDKTYTVNCNIEDKLIYHFKYDENNTKPFMSCNTYTSADKIRLDSMLKQVVNEAGYGTRAGVVAAARFLVGGLDYKIPYLGPKTVDSSLGRYQKIGLNIGQRGSWGCSVSGWKQGMDCTNFVSWAFYQNGILGFPYNTNHKPVRSVINQIRVGDLLYTPCTSNCKNDYKLNHVGIIIGIDNNYIYVAESTTGDVNAIIVTKWQKNNMPTSGKFSVVHFFNYAKDGNVTNMWIS